eukprot:1148974-Pelagomonas_calceolata.AAC.2
MMIVSFVSASVLAHVHLCMWLTVWGRAALATGEGIFYLYILSIRERVTVSPGVRIMMGGGIGRAVLVLYDRADEIRCKIMSVEGYGRAH